MLRAARHAGLLLLAASPLAAAPASPSVRFPALKLGAGGTVSAHQSASGDPSDAAAARRRAEILRSPYARLADRRPLRAGEAILATDSELPAETRDALLRDLPTALSSMFERDGWPKPFSVRSPLLVGIVSGPATSAAGWDGREKDGSLRTPVVAVSSAGRDASAVLLDALHQIALLSLRQAAPDEAGWAAEGLAEFAARRAAGLSGAAVPADDPLLDEAGALTSPPVLAAFLEALAPRLPKGAFDVREAWEAAGSSPGDDAESFLRDLAGRAGGALADVLAAAVASRLEAALADGAAPGPAVGRRAWLLAPVSSGGAAPLGWRRVSLRTDDERGGLELSLPPSGFASARAILLYRGEAGDFDALPLAPGATRHVPAAGTMGLHLVLADGDGSDVPVRVRRAPEYPAALAASGAAWRGHAVEVSWETSQHRALLAWVVERREEGPDGEAAPVRDTLPAASESDEPTGYLYVDRDARPGARYRYRVLALTTDGLLSEAFEARVETR